MTDVNLMRSRERFSVTYDVITPESAEHADVAESGFASPGGCHDDCVLLTLRDAISAAHRHVSRYGAGFYDSGSWWTTTDSDENYRTGESTSYAIHPPETITAASYARVTRLLCGSRS